MVAANLQVDSRLQVYEICDDVSLGLDLQGDGPGEYGEAFLKALHPEDKALFERLIVGDTGSSLDTDTHLRVRDASGRYRIFLANLHPGDARWGEDNKRLELIDPRQTEKPRYELPDAMIRTIMTSTDDYIFFKDTHHMLLAGSERMATLCQSIDRWEEFAGKADYDVFPEHLADMYYALEVEVYAAKGMAKAIQPYTHRDGRRGWVDNRKYPILDQEGRLLGLYGVARDVSTEIDAQRRQALVTSVFANAAESIVILNGNHEIVDANKTFESFTGLSREEVLGKSLKAAKHARDDSGEFEALWDTLLREGSCSGEVTTFDARGHKRSELCRITAVIDDQGEAHHFVCLYSDITPLKEHERELETIAHFDPLTGLVNRSLFEDRLYQAVATSERQGTFLALAYIDLDGFKLVNDSFGHAVGDRYLIAIADNMNEALRDTDTLARIGGDEFIALISDLDDPEGFAPVVERLLQATSKPVMLEGQEIPVSASIGIARFPLDGLEPGSLVRCADQAMYEAKRQGKNRFYVFDRGLVGNEGASGDVRRALADEEFELFYQPKVNMLTGELLGVEALARWRHPHRGLLQPPEFLPLIDRENLQIEFGEWVLSEAVEQIRQWRGQEIATQVSVNIAGVHLLQSNFLESLGSAIARYPDLLAKTLEIEILETSALNDVARVAKIIEYAHAFGVSFALDDFGTGFSSLTHLRRLPVSTVKIDTSFVRDMLESSEDTAIVSAMVGLCRGLGRQVIAEGVSTPAHAQALVNMACNFGQGYAIAAPMPAKALAGWIENWQHRGLWRDMVAPPLPTSGESGTA
ncbi:putative bifunctional diguanylate cyclase/phosphodiesterase [Congregibacter litoralis]|uniref:PAS domain protein S-box/diguanylate cyclase (GGDEF) domain protein n=1 Tax=Congregibacter litoralis KT71 TaxID=314285 RepID=A4A7F0_9GAMM|nr:EAL domain-containing protein [Congregibacter litoralis]EAQ98219.1 PAS domain protein S-box/diguanylate cyclase (GGDEF) domain protein [Congregibacter litoralis KT71]